MEIIFMFLLPRNMFISYKIVSNKKGYFKDLGEPGW